MIKIPNTDEITVHEEAMEPYKLSLEHYYQFEKKLPDLLDKELTLEIAPVHVIKEDKKYKMIAGWFWLSRIDFSNYKIPAIVYKDIDIVKIKMMAWQYLLSLQLTSFHRSTNLAQFKNILDQMPPYIKDRLILNHQKKTNLATIQNISNENRIVIRNQLKKL